MRVGSLLCGLPYYAATIARGLVRALRAFAPFSALRLRSLSVRERWSLLVFCFVYLALIRYSAYAFFRDPTSYFFDSQRGYDRIYSLERQKQAIAFVENATASSPPIKTHRDPKLCVGIATVSRLGEQYIRATVGSLLDGLTETERAELHLAILVAHTIPDDHPVYEEPWLAALADEVLLYDVSQPRFNELQIWEDERNFRKKGVFDYAYTLQKCMDTGAPWIAMIEDDTLAVKGWYARTIDAVEASEDQLRATAQRKDWLYLRLFFTEEFLGWNSEEWVTYLLASIGVVGTTTVLLVLLRQFPFAHGISVGAIYAQALFFTPALIGLYFLAGRISMQSPRPGVYEMSNYGCCAQGLVFSHEMTGFVIGHLAMIREGFVDVILEAWANERGFMRWVAIPSILQHIGGHSSKGDDFGGQAKYDRSVAQKIWNFGFENYRIPNR